MGSVLRGFASASADTGLMAGACVERFCCRYLALCRRLFGRGGPLGTALSVTIETGTPPVLQPGDRVAISVVSGVQQTPP